MSRFLICGMVGVFFASTSATPLQGADSHAEAVPPRGAFSLALAGDLLGPYKTDAGLQDVEVMAALAPIRNADAAFANEEGSAFDKRTFDGSLGAENGGGYPLHSLSTIRRLKEAGIDLLSHANNHAVDFGIDGMLATDRTLEAVGFAHAGSGRSLAEARAPAVYVSPRGKVALVAAASTFPGMSPAAGPARELGPRPGISALHTQQITLVTRPELRALRTIALRGGWQGISLPGPDAREVHLGDAIYRVADRPGITYDVSLEDQNGLIQSVVAATSLAEVVLFSIHAHETGSGAYDDPAPASFLQPLFHALIDAGADVVVRHGPHSLMGIEIYKGRPVFYGMGSLVFDLPRSITAAGEGPASSRMTVELPDAWFESAIAVTEFAGRQPVKILVYPLMIDRRDGATYGSPRRAVGSDAARILARVADASRQFGTRIAIEGDRAMISLAR